MNETISSDGTISGLLTIDVITLFTVVITSIIQLYEIYERKSRKLECGKNCCCEYFLYQTDDSDTESNVININNPRKTSISNV